MEHRKRLGLAIYEFIWCIDKVTKEIPESGGKQDGIVLGGAPVKVGQIAKDLGEDARVARRNLVSLAGEGYITRTRTPYGFSIKVRNSQKFKIWGERVDKSVQSDGIESGQKCPERVDKSVRNKEDHARNHAVKETQQKALRAELWNLLGIRPEEMPPLFREHAEQLYAGRNGDSATGFVGALMEGWKALGLGKHPPVLAQAAKRIREEAKNPAPAPIRPLPEMPFQKKKVGQCQPKN